MEREVSLEDISDGKLYGINDMVRADSGGCEGCSACCRGMGSSIILDPLDMFRLTGNLGMTPEQLLSGPLEVNMVDGIILPNIRMTGRDEACSFLNGEGRCGIHSYRPGFCRLFPLGRLYENRSFSYFLQVHECPKDNRSKVKVRKWIDTPEVKLYEKFVNDWHYFLKDLEHGLEENGSLDIRRTVVMYVLNQFYITPYNSGEAFYPQFTGGLQRLLSLRHVPESKPAFKSSFRISTNGQEEDSYGIRCSIEGKKKHEKVPAGQESEP